MSTRPPDEDLAGVVGRTIRSTRTESRWSQRELANRLGVSQSAIARLESGRLHRVDSQLVTRAFDLLGVRHDINRATLGLAGRREQLDAVHARCSDYLIRRLRSDGWLATSEVEIGDGRSRGWIDVLAFRPMDRALLVVEVKTEIRDVGAILRTIGWYQRSAWAAGRKQGWRSTNVSLLLLVLDTIENDLRVRSSDGLLRDRFPARGRVVSAWLAAPGGGSIGALAMVDPLRRRRDWLLATRADGRRAPAAYADYRDAATTMARRR